MANRISDYSTIPASVFSGRTTQLNDFVEKLQLDLFDSADKVRSSLSGVEEVREYAEKMKSEFIKKNDRVLLIDDFLANGEAAFGASRLLNEAGAYVAGIGIVIAKAFQPGLKKLRAAGFRVEVLAPVIRMGENLSEFGEE